MDEQSFELLPRSIRRYNLNLLCLPYDSYSYISVFNFLTISKKSSLTLRRLFHVKRQDMWTLV